MKIRVACLEDATALADLSHQLGYPAAVAEVGRRLERVLASPEDVVYVAHDDAQRVSGWIHGARQDLVESEPRCEILGLVVQREQRRRGIARALVQAVEQWASTRGLRLLSVRSAVSRAESHPFYESLGYERVKSQHVYRKILS